MKVSQIQSFALLAISLFFSACGESQPTPPKEAPQVTVAPVQSQAVTVSQRYTCQIRAHHHIDIRAPETGYLADITIQTGQTVKEGDLLFRLRSPLHHIQSADSDDDAVLIRAPFDGVVGNVSRQSGGLIQKGETLASLTDNSQIWVYFNVPEARYLEYQAADPDHLRDDLKVELMTASGHKFDQPGHLAAIGAGFNAETGSITFRADFPNPDGTLRHGQIGSISISEGQKDAIVVPKKSTFEVGGLRYVYVVGQNDVAHQREIDVQKETDDMFVVKSGVHLDEPIIVDGVRQVRDGEKVDYDHLQSKSVAAHVK
jgi:membrane fusion protein (multidrug efflux system)